MKEKKIEQIRERERKKKKEREYEVIATDKIVLEHTRCREDSETTHRRSIIYRLNPQSTNHGLGRIRRNPGWFRVTAQERMHRRRLLVFHKSRSSDASFVRLFVFPSSFFLSFVLFEPSISIRSTNNRATISGGQLTYFPAVSLRRIGNLATFPNHGWKIRATSFSRICGDNMRHEFPALRSSPPRPVAAVTY